MFYIKQTLLAIFILLISGCDNKTTDGNIYEYEATTNKAAESPSGKYLLEIFMVDTEYRFKIIDIDNKTAFVYDGKPNDFHRRFTTWFIWDEDNKSNDVVWCYSGDWGTFNWKQNDSGLWEMSSYENGDYSPAEFRKRRPNHYN